MELSVITVTFGRLGVLRQKLESLGSQTLRKDAFELVLCINADPETLRAVSALTPPFALELIGFERRQGASVARNACAKRASGSLLYFSDDDAILQGDTLERHLAFHKDQAREVAAVGGVDWEHGGRVERMRPRRVGYWNLHGVNTSLPKSVFERAGGFPEWLEGYGLEDVLLGYALETLGVPLKALPEAPVRHLGANPMWGSQPDKAVSAGRNAARVLERHPELAFRLGLHPLLLALKRLYLPLLRRVSPRFEGDWLYTQSALEALRSKGG